MVPNLVIEIFRKPRLERFKHILLSYFVGFRVHDGQKNDKSLYFCP